MHNLLMIVSIFFALPATFGSYSWINNGKWKVDTFLLAGGGIALFVVYSFRNDFPALYPILLNISFIPIGVGLIISMVKIFRRAATD